MSTLPGGCYGAGMRADAETEQPSSERNFAEQLRRAREAQGVSQSELARVVSAYGIPMRQQTITRIETGHQSITMNQAAVLSAALHRPLADMLQPVAEDMTVEQARFAAHAAEMQEAGLEAQLTAAVREEYDARRRVQEIRAGLAAVQERRRLLTSRLMDDVRRQKRAGGMAPKG